MGGGTEEVWGCIQIRGVLLGCGDSGVPWDALRVLEHNQCWGGGTVRRRGGGTPLRGQR